LILRPASDNAQFMRHVTVNRLLTPALNLQRVRNTGHLEPEA